jgi:hypothetical protein
MPYTLGQAARATGKAKPTITRAIQAGRISAIRSDDGSWSIDPAELHRVYPMTGQSNGHELRDVPDTLPATDPAELLVERNRLVAEQAETIRDLRHRLDASEAERRAAQERLTAVLTHRQAGSVPAVDEPASAPRQAWWPVWGRRRS